MQDIFLIIIIIGKYKIEINMYHVCFFLFFINIYSEDKDENGCRCRYIREEDKSEKYQYHKRDSMKQNEKQTKYLRKTHLMKQERITEIILFNIFQE
jgi:hypothetical protein